MLGEPHEVGLYLMTTNNLRRMLSTLGLERRPRDVSSTLDLMRQKPDWTPLRARVEAEAAEVIDAEEASK
jgi:hypothetical protein